MNKECPYCHGTSWIFVENNGRRVGRRCDCFLHGVKNKIVNQAKIPVRYHNCYVNNFKNLGNQNLINAENAVREFLVGYPGDRTGLLIQGPPGVGKTHLAVGIVHYLIEDHNIPCLFCDFRVLLQRIRSTYDHNSQLSEQSITSPVLNTELLVLDELGAEKTTQWVRDTLMFILNSRYNQMLPTIITTNYPDREDLMYSSYRDHWQDQSETLEDRIGSRLRSRLHEMCNKICIEADDYRKRTSPADTRKGIRSRLSLRQEDLS